MFPLQISQCMIHILILLGRPNPHISPNFTYFYTCLYNPSYSKSYTHSNFTLSPSLTNGGIFKSNNRMESANSEKKEKLVVFGKQIEITLFLKCDFYFPDNFFVWLVYSLLIIAKAKPCAIVKNY